MLFAVGGWRPSIRGISFEMLEVVDAVRLEEPFSKQEVLEALKGFYGVKAPRPDGFAMDFWQSSWEFVKEEVMGFFRDFHNHGRFVKSLNATFIVLILKKGEAEDLRDFKLISLVGSLYKWLAKVLANRLKMVVRKVVSKAQNAFVEGRQILYVVLVANEVLDSVLKGKDGVVMCKLDIEKAYDHVECCRGLRQGDPLSSYLFVMVMEAFSSLLRSVVNRGFVSACKAMSGLRINLNKSELIPMGSVENAVELVATIGCKVGSLPTTYLGLPLGAPYRSLVVWDGVEERMRKKLARWKSQYISKGSRITLTRSTLASMPIYFMSMLSIPRKVRLRLERIQRDFLWGGGALEKKPHLVRWDLVYLEKCNGGLEVKSLSIPNKALLCKWSWRFAIEREAFWNQVIRGKYGKEHGRWSSKEAREGVWYGLWKTLRKE
ncbi:uncharacterized protein LOC117909152 [Vitis riparia]|uniref:uncharacterized protein LOC117909152 n=1 Tax=Vitis riparia TaxID=96939 RepID=UPI00155AA972|nr:uncharacterized protein LOC117909152 [Vitis riparia]